MPLAWTSVSKDIWGRDGPTDGGYQLLDTVYLGC
jgi:hypothetical protein